ncbi:MAG TPA: STAS domain-containing protein [Vicinamibacterales bacterium]|jgi:rsbT co-antagonist protein RsbR|nr:STAS domain-containing protein [Vicinamibacterales bacterium]
MTNERIATLNQILDQDESGVLRQWIDDQTKLVGFRSDRLSRQDLNDESRRFLSLFRAALNENTDIQSPAWEAPRQMLEELSASRAELGFTPSETAIFVFSLKQALFNRLRAALASQPEKLATVTWDVSLLLDKLGLFTTEVYQKRREQVIIRQQEEMMELSTPVVTLWEGVLALPLIGTLDSSRTQVVMESLLQRIVESGAPIAIIDITGVPTVDTLTAQHLLKTVAAARLMGADCIISGIRPQIAQTIVHLGVDLGVVVTKASLAGAFAVALRRLGLAVTRSQAQKGRGLGADQAATARDPERED